MTKEQLKNIKKYNMEQFENLMTEIGFQITKLNDGTIDKDDFINAVEQIHEYYNTTITI